MQNASSDERSLFKLAQIWQIAGCGFELLQQSYSRNCIINEIIKDDFNINHKFTSDYIPTIPDGLQQKASIHLKNCTALHFLYYAILDIDTFTTFIEHGADYTIKNENGQTALHLMILPDLHYCSIEQRIPFINSVLSAHVKSQNFTNPCDNDGISHFHGACMANHIKAAELFINNGASIEETVNFDAPEFAGWTPLHFAVAFGGFEVAQILVRREANVNAQTAKGTTPLDLVFRNYFRPSSSKNEIFEKEELVKLLLGKSAISAVGLSSLHVACTLKDLTIAERLLDEGADIDYAVPSKSPILPGHTAVHFAAENGIEAVKILVTRGAKFDLAIVQKDPKLELYKAKYSLQQLCEILSCIESVKETRMSDGQTKLLDLISAMESLDNFRRFLQNKTVDITAVVPGDSVLWPGYTIVHLAVTFSKVVGLNNELLECILQYDTTILEECLNRELNLDVANLEEQTSIQLAYMQNKKDIVRLMLEHLNRREVVRNLVDQNNLSYLHIACAIGDEALVNRLLGVSDPNDLRRSITKSVADMEAGSTPLHVAVSGGSRAIAELLLRRGADLHATDASGMTPIHLLYKHIFFDENDIVDCLLGSLSTNVVDRVVDGLGLSYLHIASVFGFAEVVEKLLDLGSNVNAIVDCQEYKSSVANFDRRCLTVCENFTPLQMAVYTEAIEGPNNEVLDALLRHGADIFLNKSNKCAKRMGSSRAPFENAQVVQRFFRALWEREDMQKSMEQKLGLTKLHVACFLKNEESIISVLTDAVGVNVPVLVNSIIFAGCTPLHLLMMDSVGGRLLDIQTLGIALGNMVKMLIDRGADVTFANVEKSTPIQEFAKIQRFIIDGDLCKNLLLDAHRDFSVNPVNGEGWSHFHLACYWHRVDVVEKFLQHGSVNVNQALDYFINSMAGCTPLHLALNSPMTEPNLDWTRLSQTVDLLLKHGADVAAKDVRGNTPLHTWGALNSPGMSVFEKLVSCGGDVKCEDLQGQSPIELLASISMATGNPTENLTIFRKYGYRINSWNRLTGEGYIAKIFLLRNQQNLSVCSEFKKFVESSDARTVDDLGRTAIHNAVSHSANRMDVRLENDKYAIESFMKIGIDIEHRDKLGQTALHYAARMKNFIGVKVLLAVGADLNAVDNSGKSPFTYVMNHFRNRSAFDTFLLRDVTTALRLHVRKLKHLKVEVSQLNQSLAEETQRSWDISIFQMVDNATFDQTFFSQVEMTKTMDVGINSLALYDFLSETAALTLYPLLLKSERELVDHFFDSLDYNELKELAGIVKLQTRKMRARLGLIDSAFSSLRMLLGFSVPGLCEQISRFLPNSDLKNLIDSNAP